MSKITCFHWYAFMRFQYPAEVSYNRHIHPIRHARALLAALESVYTMPKPSGRGSNARPNVEFVVVNLDGPAEKDFRKYAAENLEKLVSLVGEFINDGHKLGMTWDDANACFIASATCWDEKSENYANCITARSDDWSEALLLLVFKHRVIAKGQAWALVSRPAAWG